MTSPTALSDDGRYHFETWWADYVPMFNQDEAYSAWMRARASIAPAAESRDCDTCKHEGTGSKECSYCHQRINWEPRSIAPAAEMPDVLMLELELYRAAATDPAVKAAINAWGARSEPAAASAEPSAYVNGDDLDNMLDDRTAVIQRNASGSRKTPLYRAAKPTLIAARPLEWEPQAITDWADKYCGFYISCELEDTEHPYRAAWGEGDSESFVTLGEAQAWCQRELDGWIRRFALVTPATAPAAPSPGASDAVLVHSAKSSGALPDAADVPSADARDAERYRWLRAQIVPRQIGDMPALYIGVDSNRFPNRWGLGLDEADAAIDAALAAPGDKA